MWRTEEPFAAVLYSGQPRAMLNFPAIMHNHVRFFDGLFRARSSWDAFLFADVSTLACAEEASSASPAAALCDSAQLKQALSALALVDVRVWAPAMDGDVPIDRVAGYCRNATARPRAAGSACIFRNLSDRFDRAYAGYRRSVAVARVMRLKHHIFRAAEMMQRHTRERRGGRDYKIVVRVRPDSWFDNQWTASLGEPWTELTPLSPSTLLALVQKRILVLPREWAWGGVNDRFAIGGFREMKLYSDQYLHMQEGWQASDGGSVDRVQECPGWIHSESFLRCNLVRHGVTFLQLPVGLFLVREDGRKQILGHMREGGLHSCTCISWRMQGDHARAGVAYARSHVEELAGKGRRADQFVKTLDRQASVKPIPEWNYIERCGKQLNLSLIAGDPAWTQTAFVGADWRYGQEKPCKGARWWRQGISTGHHEWGSRR